MPNNLKSIASDLAKQHAQAEPNIEEILFFPDDQGKEIRLVEIDPTAMPSEDKVVPFYFAPDPLSGIRVFIGVALILPEEKNNLVLPEGWGAWETADRIWFKGGE